jgi:methylated-DNA-[protein]-cysteine S-methyltransferase
MTEIPNLFFDVISTPFCPLAVIWWNTPSGPRIRKIHLSRKNAAAKIANAAYPHIQQRSCLEITELGGRIQRFLSGEPLAFNLEMIALEVCGEFQQKVLLAEYGIPRGWVSTYGQIARHIGAAGGGRAAGRALATNPFPIIIPCHRAVRADGELGGYQGGTKMKQKILEMEGVAFLDRNLLLMDRVYY